MGCDGGDDYLHNGGGDSDRRPYEDAKDPLDPSSWIWRSGGVGEWGNNGGAFDLRGGGGGAGGKDSDGSGGGDGGDLLTQPGAAVKKAAKQGVAWLSDALAKLKAAAEDTAHAASRPRHW